MDVPHLTEDQMAEIKKDVSNYGRPHVAFKTKRPADKKS